MRNRSHPVYSERIWKVIVHSCEINRAVHYHIMGFETPLDVDDARYVSTKIQLVTKQIQDEGFNWKIYTFDRGGVDFGWCAEILNKAAEEVLYTACHAEMGFAVCLAALAWAGWPPEG